MEFQRDINSFIERQNWIFAKTMADIPHWCCLKSKTPDPDAYGSDSPTLDYSSYDITPILESFSSK